MGTRYYAYPVTRAQLPAALLSPRTAIPPDPLVTSFIPRLGGMAGAESIDDLYLDKIWGRVGALFETERDRPNRPAHELFKGNATMAGVGWIPWEQVVGPDELIPIASDLYTAGRADVYALLNSPRHCFTKEDGECILQYLQDAQAYVRRRIKRDEGMVIMIG